MIWLVEPSTLSKYFSGFVENSRIWPRNQHPNINFSHIFSTFSPQTFVWDEIDQWLTRLDLSLRKYWCINASSGWLFWANSESHRTIPLKFRCPRQRVVIFAWEGWQYESWKSNVAQFHLTHSARYNVKSFWLWHINWHLLTIFAFSRFDFRSRRWIQLEHLHHILVCGLIHISRICGDKCIYIYVSVLTRLRRLDHLFCSFALMTSDPQLLFDKSHTE
jgi:hypothetical protein